MVVGSEHFDFTLVHVLIADVVREHGLQAAFLEHLHRL